MNSFQIGLLGFVVLFGCAEGTADAVFAGGGGADAAGGTGTNGGAPSNGGAPTNGGDTGVTSTSTSTSTNTSTTNATTTTTSGTSCGDFACNGGETCGTCPTDCGACQTCGDAICQAGETAVSCRADCGGGGGTCNHGPCQIGDPLDPSCDPCAGTVCNVLGVPECCQVTWDDFCTLVAEIYCGCVP